jgi:membrane protein required for colicin V production
VPAMIAAQSAPASFNWYDIVVVVALLYGVWSGVRMGLFGEILRVVGMILTVVAAMHFCEPAGAWLKGVTGIAGEPARLTAFVAIAVAVWLIMLLVRNFITGKVKKFKFWAMIDNLGGAVAGLARMIVVMTAVTIGISLMRSPFWHNQVSTNSIFGSTVVAQFPSVAEVVKKKFPEKLWMTEELQRREELDIENSGTKTTPR